MAMKAKRHFPVQKMVLSNLMQAVGEGRVPKFPRLLTDC